ncbi:hypothetical protein [Jiella pacifica]|uniref:SCP2 domain-containing protein n=1 Tax=Jiella pacifica TaxID=2696469 RepID=A0A6N9TBC2_9HYPH|nr:hypothetical protein [Jiella pacifica]NDW07872.1 hypothetical protein [Jiella pacifica]
MTEHRKQPQGTVPWFEMVGAEMSRAASRSGLSPDLTVSLVERYSDGTELGEGLVQGLRFDIVAGKPSFRVGVRPDERGDVTIVVTAAAARRLNALYGGDPTYPAARAAFLASGAMRVDGDPSRLGGWLETVHDPIVDRTSQP